MFKTRKVVIVGAGHVGSHVALALIQSGEADDIVLIDILKEKAIGQALDLDDCVSGSLCGKDVSIRAGSSNVRGYERARKRPSRDWCIVIPDQCGSEPSVSVCAARRP